MEPGFVPFGRGRGRLTRTNQSDPVVMEPGPGTIGRGRGRLTRERSISSELDLMSVDSAPSSECGPGRGREGAITRRQLHSPPVTRPASVSSTVGEGGRPVELFANYVEFETPKDLLVQQYQVDFEPSVENIRMRRALLFEATHAMLNKAYTFDGMFNLKTLTKLEDEFTEVSAVRRTDNVDIKITLKYTGTVDWTSPEMMRLFNTQMRDNLRTLNYVQMGRNYFDPMAKLKIEEHKVDIWPGISTAINRHDGGTLMVVDTVHKVVRADTALDILRELRKNQAAFKDNARRELAGVIVMTNFNNRTYKVDDVVFDKNPTFKFERKGREMSLVEYYQEQHGITIQDLGQPLLVVLPSAREMRAAASTNQATISPILLVPELCRMTGLTDSLESNFSLKRQMAQLTQLGPMTRFSNLRAFIKNLQENSKVSEQMSKWCLKLSSMPVALTGRVLEVQGILMRGDVFGDTYNQRSGDFSKEIRNKAMRACVDKLSSWVIVVSSSDEHVQAEFSATLEKVSRPLGMDIRRPTIEKVSSHRTSDFVGACKKVAQISGIQMIVVILPNDAKDRYDAIKKLLCIDIPIPSQMIVTRTLSKKPNLMSVCTKVAIQMAAKLGGVPWEIKIPPKKLMVVGYDTYHDSTFQNKSVGAFVGSMNDELSKWFSQASYHSSSEEMSSHFADNLISGLKRYHKVNNYLPERLIIYRDGVGDGQIQHVFNFEVEQIKKALTSIDADCIKLTFVIVTKRVSARFFTKLQAPNLENPMPGTVVDSVVTRPERYEFYLIGQATRIGTVSPTCYNIILDESGWKPQNQQTLAWKLCHSYFNWAGTISVPAPCQYAHKLALFVGTNLHREPSIALSNSLFYL